MKDETLKNLTEIDVSHLFEFRSNYFNYSTNSTEQFSKDMTAWNLVNIGKHYFRDIAENMLNNTIVRALIRSDENFDVVIVEPHSPLVFAFGERFKAPVIGKYKYHGISKQKKTGNF